MNIEHKIKEILCNLSGEKKIESNFYLQGELAMDSLMMVTMLVEIEDAFSIELDESDMNPFELETVQNVIDMVVKYCGNEDE